MVKEMGVKNLSSSIQGDQVRVTGKHATTSKRRLPSSGVRPRVPLSSPTSGTKSGHLFDVEVLVDLLTVSTRISD